MSDWQLWYVVDVWLTAVIRNWVIDELLLMSDLQLWHVVAVMCDWQLLLLVSDWQLWCVVVGEWLKAVMSCCWWMTDNCGVLLLVSDWQLWCVVVGEWLKAVMCCCWWVTDSCDVMWCDVMWCDVMWCDVMWCDVMWCDVMWCDVVEAREFLLYISGVTIHRYLFGTRHNEVLALSNVRDAVSVEYDLQRNCIYWGENTVGIIRVGKNHSPLNNCTYSWENSFSIIWVGNHH